MVQILQDGATGSAASPASAPGLAVDSSILISGAPPPGETPRSNATFILCELVATYLITHTHLDYLAGFDINTALFAQDSSSKLQAALPHAITVVKTQILLTSSSLTCQTRTPASAWSPTSAWPSRPITGLCLKA